MNYIQHRLLSDREYDRGGDREFRRLFYLDAPEREDEKKRGKRSHEDDREFKKLDSDLRSVSGYENLSTALNRVTMGVVIEQIDVFTVLDVNFAVMSVMPTQSGIDRLLVHTTDYLRDVLAAADCYDIYVNDFPDKQLFDQLFVLANTVHDTHGLVHRHRQALADFCLAHKDDLEMPIRRYAAVLKHYGPVNEVVEMAYGLRPAQVEVAGGVPQVDTEQDRLMEAIIALWRLQGGSA